MTASTPVVIVGDALIDGTGARPVGSPMLTVRGDRIESIRSRESRESMPEGFRVIDASGCTVLPGLIDTHLHLATILPVARPRESLREDLTNYLAGISRAQSALLGGVTTIRDCGGPELFNIELRNARNAGLWVGPRILACGYPLTTTAGHCHWMGGRADDAAALRRRVRYLAEHRVDFIKVMVTGGMITPGSNPYRTQYSVHELRPAIDDAHRLNLRVAAHALCTAGVALAAECGVDTIEHGWTITGQPQDFDPTVIESVLRSGATASVTAHQSLRSLLPSRPGGGDKAELMHRLAPHRALYSAGVPMVVHSDAVGGSSTSFADFGESIEVFAHGMDVDVAEAVAAATGRAARALGMGADTGTLEAGKLADITIVQGDLRRDFTALQRVRDVLIAGAEVVRRGELVTSPTIHT